MIVTAPYTYLCNNDKRQRRVDVIARCSATFLPLSIVRFWAPAQLLRPTTGRTLAPALALALALALVLVLVLALSQAEPGVGAESRRVLCVYMRVCG